MKKTRGRPSLRDRLAEWEEGPLRESLQRLPERRPEFRLDSGVPVARLYAPLDAPGDDYVASIGCPGLFPFTRGVQPTMYRSRFWTMRQYSGFGDAAETNKRLHYLLARGQTGLSIAFDLPTQMGYDSDNPLSQGEVGRVGVAIDTIDDMQELLRDLPLDRVSTSMTINATASILLALYVAVARARGVPLDRLSGTVQNDVLKEYIARGTYIYPPAASLRIISDLFAYCQRELPRWNAISVSGYHIREAGSTAVQEVAFTFANGIAYLEAARERGLEVEEIAGQISFFFNAHNHFLEEIAKFRAARRIWARWLRDTYGATSPRAQWLRFHTQTAGVSLTAQQPEVNVVRTAIEALAGVLGGTQSMHTNSWDEALALPTEDAVRIALRTQQVIAHETGVVNTIDPLGGSYYVEHLTDELERQAYAYFERIEQLGGVVAAIKENFFQAEIADAAFRYQQEVESEERVIVGVNRYQTEGQPEVEIHRVDPVLETEQIARVRELRGRRDATAVEVALARLQEDAAHDDRNLMGPIMDAARVYVTMGEMCDALREVWGIWRETPVF